MTSSNVDTDTIEMYVTQGNKCFILTADVKNFNYSTESDTEYYSAINGTVLAPAKATFHITVEFDTVENYTGSHYQWKEVEN